MAVTMQEVRRRLTIEASSRGVTEATAAAQALGKAVDGVAVAGQRSERSTVSMERALNSIQRRYDAAFRSQQQMAEIERKLIAAQAQGLVTSERRMELLSLAAERHGVASAAISLQAEKLRELAAAERMAASAADAQASVNSQLGVQAYTPGAARQSASVFSAELARMEEIARMRGEQTGRAFGEALESRLVAGTGKSARDAASVFTAELDRLDEIARMKAEQAGAQFQASLNASFGIGGSGAGSARASAAVFEETAREMEQLRSKFDPLYAASKRYEMELGEINRAQSIGAITSRQHGLALTELNMRYQSAATGAETFSTSSGMARMQTQNLMYQIQDIGTMMAMGQNPFMLLAQQLPQVTQHGGQLTGVMTALRGTMAGLFSPLGLLTTGFVLAGSAAVSYFTSATDESDAAADALAEQESLIQRVADRWGDAVPALREYAQAMEEARDAGDLQKATQIVQNSYLDELRDLLPQVNSELSRFVDQAASGGWGSALEQDASTVAAAFDEVYSALQDAAVAISEGEDATDELAAANEALSSLLNSDAIPAVGGMADALGMLTGAYGAATSAAQELNRQMAIEAAQEANRGRFDKTGQRVSPDGVNPLNPNDFMRRFGWEEIINFPKERKARRPRKTDEERSAESYADMIRDAQQYIAMQELEQRALFMSEEAANALRYEQELLNQAANDNIKLTPQMTAELKAYAIEMAQAEAETQRLREAMDFAKDVTRGFIDDFRSGIEQGKSVWESFASAALNALDKIVDKLLDDVMDALFQVNGAASGGGILGWIGKIIGGIGGGGVDPWRGLRLSGGGYTGDGGMFDPAGIVHRGEYVFSAAATQALGVGNLERMHRAANLPSALGGMAAGVPSQAPSAGPSFTTIRLILPEGFRSEIVEEAAGRAQQDTVRIVTENDHALPEKLTGLGISVPSRRRAGGGF